MRGTWKSVVMSSLRCVLKLKPGLLGVQLDDELLLHRRRDLRALRVAQDLRGERIVVRLQPGGDGRDELGRPANRVGRGRVGLDRDHVFRTYLVGRDVDPAAVDHPVPVTDELAGLTPRSGETE